MNDFNTSAQGRELGWEDEIQQESSYILLPEGDYRFTVERFDRARHDGSGKIPPCNKAIVFIRVFGMDGSSVLLQENLFLHTMMEWKLSEFFASIGMKQKGQAARMNWQEVNGKSGICHVIIREYDKRDGSGKGKRNQIDKLYPSYDQPQLLYFTFFHLTNSFLCDTIWLVIYSFVFLLPVAAGSVFLSQW